MNRGISAAEIIVEYLIDGEVCLNYPDSCSVLSSAITGPEVVELIFSHGVSPKLNIGDIVRIRKPNPNDRDESCHWAAVSGIKKTGTYPEFFRTTVRAKPLDLDEVPFETLLAFKGIHGTELTVGTFGCTGAVPASIITDRAEDTEGKQKVWIDSGDDSGYNRVPLSTQLTVDVKTALEQFKQLGEAIQKALGLEGEEMYLPEIEKVIFNPPATIVMWSDGTKTVVKATDTPPKGKKRGDKFREDYGLAMAIAKKYFGNRSRFLKAVENASRRED